MQEKTKDDYRKLAANFYKKNGLTEDLRTPKRIADALKNSAGEYRPNYFRRLRNALEFDQKDKGFDKAADRIKEVKNPLTKPDAPVMIKRQIKPKQSRCKTVNERDFQKLYANVRERKDLPLAAALMVSKKLGVRPKELFNIEVGLDNKVFVKGAKKRDDRGLDRWIELEDRDFDGIVKALSILNEFKNKSVEKGLKSTPEHLLQERLRSVTKDVFPRRKSRMTLYSFRHQLGSNLKGSGIDRKQVAYLMGHQSTESVEVYGDKRFARSKINISPGVSQEQINQVVRENHAQPLSEQVTAEPVRSYEGDSGLSF